MAEMNLFVFICLLLVKYFVLKLSFMSQTLKFKHFYTIPLFQFINLFLVTLHCMLTTVCCINEVCIHILILKVSYVLISLVYSLYVCRFCIFWGMFYFVRVE